MAFSLQLGKRALLIGTAIISIMSANAAASDLSVVLNKTKILKLPHSANTVIVGNPAIADVSIFSSDTIFIIGRGYGQTNLIALDEDGNAILESNIHVGRASGANDLRVTKIDGGQSSYHCSPECLPAPILGDDPGFIAKFSGQVQAINSVPVNLGRPSSNTGSGGYGTNALPAFPPNSLAGLNQGFEPDFSQNSAPAISVAH